MILLNDTFYFLKCHNNYTKKIDKFIAGKDEEICHLKNHSQNLIAQINKLKSEKKSQQDMLEQLTNKESTINKETMTNPIEIEKLSHAKIQTFEKGTNTDPIDIKNKKDAYIEILSTNESPEISKD